MKQLYEVPEVQVIDMEVQGMIAASTKPLGNPPDVDNVPI